MGKIRLVRPDGSTFDVEQEQAGRFQVLGYRPMSQEEYVAEQSSIGKDNYWSSPGQKVATALEGVTSGLTLGGSDWLLDKAGAEDFRERAAYNPGTRLGSEIVGGLLPMLAAPESMLAKTPAGLLMRGGAAIEEGASALKLGRAAQIGARGAFEGAGFGAGAALSDAVLNNDPITVEAIGAGLGWGALYGGALGAIAGKATGMLEGRAAAKAATEAAVEAQARATGEAFSGFRSQVADVSSQVDEAIKASGVVKTQVSEALKDVKRVHNAVSEIALPVGPRAGVSAKLAKQAGSAYNEVIDAAKSGDAVRMEEAFGKYKQHAEDLATITGVKVPELAPFAANSAKASITAVEDLKALNASQRYLKSFPTTVEAFGEMTPARADKMIGAIDSALNTSTPEFTGLRDAIGQSIGALGESVGIKVEGNAATQLRGIYEAVKGAAKEGAAEGAGKSSWIMSAVRRGAEYTGGRLASRGAGVLGAGSIAKTVAYEGGKKLTLALLGIKNAVVGGAAKVASELTPKLVAKGRPVGSRIEALRTRLDGSEDKGKVDGQMLMKMRSQELRDAAGSVRDTLYKNSQGLQEEHPDLAAALFEHNVARFEFILNKLPRDPGNAFSNLKSLWKPSAIETEKFARYWEVFQNPTAVMWNVLKTGRITPEAAEGLREMNPALYNKLRFDVLENISDPKKWGKMPYSAQVSLGVLLQLPLHSTMTPQFIAPQMQMFLERNQPLGISPQPGVSGGGGRPPGAAATTPGATSAQKITEH